MADEYTHNWWSAYTNIELTNKTYNEMSGMTDITGTMAFKPCIVTSITVNPGTVTTGASVLISIVIEENTHEQWSGYTHNQLASKIYDDMSGMYHWDDWESSTWDELSTLIWGA